MQQTVDAVILKNAIKLKKIEVVNLTLTEANRLIDKKEDTSNIAQEKVYTGKEAVLVIRKLQKGMPVQIKLPNNTEYMQTLYVGVQEVQGRQAHNFYDGTALSGMFALSENFIANNEGKMFSN